MTTNPDPRAGETLEQTERDKLVIKRIFEAVNAGLKFENDSATVDLSAAVAIFRSEILAAQGAMLEQAAQECTSCGVYSSRFDLLSLRQDFAAAIRSLNPAATEALQAAIQQKREKWQTDLLHLLFPEGGFDGDFRDTAALCDAALKEAEGYGEHTTTMAEVERRVAERLGKVRSVVEDMRDIAAEEGANDQARAYRQSLRDSLRKLDAALAVEGRGTGASDAKAAQP
jgi:hypothetical protein